MTEKRLSNTLLVCTHRRGAPNSPSCGGRGSHEILRLLQEGVRERRLALNVESIVCFGHCADGPTVRLAPGGRFWHQVQASQLAPMLDEIAPMLVCLEKTA
ncbi:MAG: (2Fe-2S) ferredoxin domain-containing protein [Sulfuricellaceae bacterium]|nr:(2Fe-2S) ferredoxin domain-containing protein [Sulfuricellaceae bacterium]